MIISRSPFRISFFGGGTDYPEWYRENGGAVLSTSINKYCYTTCRYLPPFHDFKYLIRYYKREEVKTLEEIQHPAVRSCLKFLDITRGVDIVHHADLPARSGLGSSSTFTVGLLHALYALKHEMPSKRQLALNAIEIEQNVIGEVVGSQDQVAASFGGFNRVEFGGTTEIQVKPYILPAERFEEIEQHVMLFFTGLARTASDIAREQVQNIKKKTIDLREMTAILDEAEKALFNKGSGLERFGRLLHDQWLIKRGLSSQISNSALDNIYEVGLKAGAFGGKLLGAGAGGFMMFFAHPDRQPAIKLALSNLLYVPVRFDHIGSQIIYFSKDEIR